MQMPCHARKALIFMDVNAKHGGSPDSAHDAFVQRPALPDKSVKLQRSNEKAGGMRRNTVQGQPPAGCVHAIA
jgi:hypothetical protein